MRKAFTYIFALIFIFGALVPPQPITAAYTLSYEIQAEAAFLMNLDTDSPMFDKNSTKKMYPASLTKIMTAILTIENISDLDGTKIPLKAYLQDAMYRANVEAGGGLSLSGILKGEELSARNLLYAIMLPSGNEAALMLADYIGDGSVEYFVEMMNNKAAEIGAVNTHFVNPNGLHDENHYTTAQDMYLIARYAMNLPGFMDIANTTRYNGGPTNIHENLYWQNTNKVIDPTSEYYYPYVSGMKTGSTPEAGRCFISTASRDGYNYLLVVMGAPYYDSSGKVNPTNLAFTESVAIYKAVFDTFKVKTLLEKGRGLGELPLLYGRGGKEYLLVMSGERFTALLPNEIEASSVILELDLPTRVAAPVEYGQKIGEVVLILADEEIGRVPVLAAETVEASTLALLLKNINTVLSSFWVKFIVVFLILFGIFYVALTVLRNINKNKYGAVKRRRKL